MASLSSTPSSPPMKRSRLSKEELYKPPTNEELNTLKETSNLYQSNLFRLQMEELISEVQMTEKRKTIITKTLQELNDVLTTLPSQQIAQVEDLAWLPSDIKVPMSWQRSRVKGQMSFHKPASVKVVGSFLLGTLTQPDLNIDLAVEMPQSCRKPKDFLNFRYHHKRALYCVYLANQLRRNDLVQTVKYGWKGGDHMRPVVVLTLTAKTAKKVQVKLHPCLPESNFKMEQLFPSESNIRQQWYFEDSKIEESFAATPHYNNSILADMNMENHLHCLYNAAVDFPSLKDGILLLKVWLHQRELDKGVHGFSGFIMSMFVAYLLSKRVLTKLMNAYQVFRNTVLHLADSDWTTKGISLCRDSSDNDLPSIQTFHQYFDVVFLDPSGCLNLCAYMTKATFQQVRQEAVLAVSFLDKKTIDSFDCLFMRPVPFVRKFDHIFHVNNLSQLKESLKSCSKFKDLQDSMIDHNGDYMTVCLPRLLEFLQQGLGSRVKLIAVQPQQDMQWDVNKPHPEPNAVNCLTFGLLLNHEHASSVLERGPEANTPKAEEFRAFWGERSELRRFQDGSISEAVVWPGETAAEKRLVCCHIIKHLLKIHAGISPDTVTYIGGQLDVILRMPSKMDSTSSLDANTKTKQHLSTGEEEILSINQVYNTLTKQLRSLKDFPLVMTSIQGISSILRGTEVFPPTPVQYRWSSKNAYIHGYIHTPVTTQPCPVWVPAVNVVCLLEGSGKWPDKLAAIQQIKAAFHIRLADLIQKQFGLITSATPKYVDILKEGFVFRVEVAHRREIGLLKETYSPEGMKMLRDNEQSMELEQRTVMLPRLTSTLHGIQQQYGCFSGCVRLAKRWVAAQLLSNHVPEEVIDLLMAHLFLQPAPYTIPSSPLVGFLRFLHLLSSHDWKTSPIIINLNDEMQDSDYGDIQKHFTENRSQLPSMFLATPTDKLNSVWTKSQPTIQILQRMRVLAEESYKVLTSQMISEPGEAATDFKLIFRPPLDLYDVIIHLRPKMVPRRGEGVDKRAQSGPRNPQQTEKMNKLPVVDFDPVTLYIQELQKAYSDLALFFYDQHGGQFIAVLWNPKAFQPQPFKVLQAKGKMPNPETTSAKEVKMIPNVEAIIEDFRLLGRGLVQSVEARTEKWTI